MQTRILTEEDREVLLGFLRPRRTECLYLLSNLAAGSIKGDGPFEGPVLGVFHQGELRGALQAVQQGSVLLACSHPHGQRALAEALLDLPELSHLRRILGLRSEVRAFFEFLRELGRGQTREIRDALLLVVTLDTLERHPSLPCRKATRADLELLVAWKRRFRIDAMGDDPAWVQDEELRQSLEISLEEGRQFLLEDQGEPVSQARLNAVFEGVGQFGGVYTPDVFRGRGYASRMVAGLTELLLETEGFEALVLTVDEAKDRAVKIYRDLGFLGLGSFRFHLLEPGSLAGPAEA